MTEKCFKYREFVFDRLQHLASNITPIPIWDVIAVGNMNAAKIKYITRREED